MLPSMSSTTRTRPARRGVAAGGRGDAESGCDTLAPRTSPGFGQADDMSADHAAYRGVTLKIPVPPPIARKGDVNLLHQSDVRTIGVSMRVIVLLLSAGLAGCVTAGTTGVKPMGLTEVIDAQLNARGALKWAKDRPLT